MNNPTRYLLTAIILACLAAPTTAFCKKKKKGKGGKATMEQTEVVPPKPASNETASPSPAPPLPQISGTLTTTSGKTFEAVAVKRVDPDGLSILHKDGVAKVLFTDLPEELRAKFGYDAQKAQAFQAAQTVEMENAARQQAAQARRKAEEDAAEAAKKEREKSAVRIEGTIIQVVPDGMIIDTEWHESPPVVSSSQSIGGGGGIAPAPVKSKSSSKAQTTRSPRLIGGAAIVFVAGHKRQAEKVDKDRIDVDAYPDGVFSYTDTLGATRRLKKYQVIKTIR